MLWQTIKNLENWTRPPQSRCLAVLMHNGDCRGGVDLGPHYNLLARFYPSITFAALEVGPLNTWGGFSLLYHLFRPLTHSWTQLGKDMRNKLREILIQPGVGMLCLKTNMNSSPLSKCNNCDQYFEFIPFLILCKTQPTCIFLNVSSIMMDFQIFPIPQLMIFSEGKPLVFLESPHFCLESFSRFITAATGDQP